MRRLVLLGVLLLLAGVVACTNSSPNPGAPAATPPVERTFQWPPKLNEPYPDLELLDQTGRRVRLSSFKGSVILLETTAMSCAGCQAFCGAHKLGAFGGAVPQADLKSIEEYFPQYSGGIELADPRLVYVQLLFYNFKLQAPSPDEARKWAAHFKMDRAKNRVVLAGTPEFLGKETYDMIPGFHLIDKNFIFRADCAGHAPRHNLYTELLPLVPKLLAAK